MINLSTHVPLSGGRRGGGEICNLRYDLSSPQLGGTITLTLLPGGHSTHPRVPIE